MTFSDDAGYGSGKKLFYFGREPDMDPDSRLYSSRI